MAEARRKPKHCREKADDSFLLCLWGPPEGQGLRGRSRINEDEEDSELGQFVEDQLTPTPIQSAYAKLLRERVEEVLETLPPRESRILRLRFGLEDGRYYTLEEVGEKFGLTRERIRQIESKALRRLRHPSRARQLRDYL